jgi:hypothetical protein
MMRELFAFNERLSDQRHYFAKISNVALCFVRLNRFDVEFMPVA